MLTLPRLIGQAGTLSNCTSDTGLDLHSWVVQDLHETSGEAKFCVKSKRTNGQTPVLWQTISREPLEKMIYVQDSHAHERADYDLLDGTKLRLPQAGNRQ